MFMKLEKWKKKKKWKKIMIGSTVGILFLIGGITIYKTFALYEEEKEFDVLRGRIGDIKKTSKDIEIAAIVDGKLSDRIPEKSEGYIVDEVECTNEAEGKWSNEDWELSVKKLTTSGTACSLNFYPRKFSEYIIAKSIGNSGIEKFEHVETNQTKALIEYRYVGTEPNNYVYFGCEENCTEENLYRIIGVLPTQKEVNGEYENRVKLIKARYYTENISGLLQESLSYFPAKNGFGYQWSNRQNNKWEESSLNNEVLNKVYWNNFGEYQNYIEASLWYLGALNNENWGVYKTEDLYEGERSNTRGSSQGSIHYVGNIGLMYPSDYGYSCGNEYKNKSIHENREIFRNCSWIYQLENTYYEWTITPEANNTNAFVWFFYPAGDVGAGHSYLQDRMFSVRPTFYLKTNIFYKKGNGSKEMPYQFE